MGEAQTCPRRVADWGPWPKTEGIDSWEPGHGVIGQDKVGLSCSFCGSLHPVRFMELVRAGWVVGPTDKNYKAYLGQPLTDAVIAERKAAWLAKTDGLAEAIRQLAREDGQSEEQVESSLNLKWNERELPLLQGSCGQEAKFYYQHLTPEEMTEFVQLYNERKMHVGYPGHFYVLPFFCQAEGAKTP